MDLSSYFGFLCLLTYPWFRLIGASVPSSAERRNQLRFSLLGTGSASLSDLYPSAGGLVPDFDPMTYNYTVEMEMCAERDNTSTWRCQFDIAGVPMTNCSIDSIAPNATLYWNQTDVDRFSASSGSSSMTRVVTITVSGHDAADVPLKTVTYYLSITLLPSTSAKLLSVSAPSSILRPPFDPAILSYSMNVTSGSAVTFQYTISPGATVTLNGNPPSAIQLMWPCVANLTTLSVLAEDRNTSVEYMIAPFQPGADFRDADAGTVDADIVTIIFDFVFDFHYQNDILGQVALVTNGVIDDPSELAILSIVPSTTTTLVKVAFLPPPCGDLQYGNYMNGQRLSSYFLTYYADADFVIGNNQGKAISASAAQTNLPYCLLGTTIEYGEVCLPPPTPPKKKLTAEQAVALATGLIVLISILILAFDAFYRRAVNDGGDGAPSGSRRGGGGGSNRGGGNKDLADLELRQRKERNDDDAHESKSIADTIADVHEEP